jgi:peroxiredoxin
MIATGERAPAFDLPAVVDGEISRVTLEEFLGTGVAVLAFYPSDFNPACADGTTGLDDLDLFSLQQGVSVLGISTDSVYSHRAFAAEYGLGVPLLADVDGAVTRDYGLAVEDADAGYLTRRAVVVVGPGGRVESTWLADGPRDLPAVEDVQSAVDGVDSTDTATSRYRVAHAHYVEGRRAFTSAGRALEDREWLLAHDDFTRAATEFETATEHFETARRFSGADASESRYERAGQKARELRQAAEWLAEAAGAHARGDGAEGAQLRRDAAAPLERARAIDGPPEPDRLRSERTGRAGDPGGEGRPSLDPGGEAGADPDGSVGPGDADGGTGPDSGADAADDDGGPDSEDPADGIGEAELAEITAEVEAQSSAGASDGSGADTESPDGPADTDDDRETDRVDDHRGRDAG